MNGCARPSWEIRRRIGSGSYRIYAHGYFHPLWSVTLWFGKKGPHTIIGKKRIVRSWIQHGDPTPTGEARRGRR